MPFRHTPSSANRLIMFFALLFSIFLVTSSTAKPFHQAVQFLTFINSSLSLPGGPPVWENDNPSAVYVGRQDGLKAADRIERLPGQPDGVTFDQYSGYVTVDPAKGRALFYYFVEAVQDAGSKPLVLWLNGGPGCSALEFGALLEVGPFRVNADRRTLTANEAAWNNVANVIFLESPAGVGFSYSNTSSDYQTLGDKITAHDSYTFLINWLERFPHYKSRDFFITGESYAGHYVPQLATLILEKNAAKRSTIIRLKGIAMGNAYVDLYSSLKGTYDYYWSHALIGDETYQKIQLTCNFSSSPVSADCQEATNTADREIGNIDAYGIYAPLCKNQTTSVQPDPCGDDYAESYMNLAEVQKAFHVRGHLPYPWTSCSNYTWNDAPTTLLPSIKDLIGRGLRVWFYSGDQDSIVPVTSTRYSINMLKLPVESQWKAWSLNDEVGGYVTVYKGLTLATVRGAGHLVPSYQPERAFVVFKAFLNGGF